MPVQQNNFYSRGPVFRPRAVALQHRARSLGGTRIRSVVPGSKLKSQWCPRGLTHTQKQRVQWLRALKIKEEQAEKLRDEWFNEAMPMVSAKMT